MDLRRLLRGLLFLAIVLGTLMRLRETFVYNPIGAVFSDPARHWNAGSDTFAQNPWIITDPPLFQIWLSVVQKVSLGAPKLVAAYAGLLSAVTPWIWYRFLRECLRGRELALLGWALFVWLPSWVGIFSYFMTETLFLPLMGASLWQTVRARRRPTAGNFYCLVALWMATALTRGIGLPLGGLACLFAWLRQPRRLRTLAVSLAMVLAVAIPLGIRNYEAIGFWSPIGAAWPNQVYAASGAGEIAIEISRDDQHWGYGFRSPSFCAKQLAPLSDWEPKRPGQIKVTANLRKGSADWAKAYRVNALADWRDRLRLRWENLVLVMAGESWPDNDRTRRVDRVALDMRFVWAPLFVGVVAAMTLRSSASRMQPLLPLLIVTWFLFQGPSLLAVNEGRYRKPVEGLLIAETLVLIDTRRFALPRFQASGKSRWHAIAQPMS